MLSVASVRRASRVCAGSAAETGTRGRWGSWRIRRCWRNRGSDGRDRSVARECAVVTHSKQRSGAWWVADGAGRSGGGAIGSGRAAVVGVESGGDFGLGE